MRKIQTIKIEDIVLDKSIYPRNSIDHKRVSMFFQVFKNLQELIEAPFTKN